MLDGDSERIGAMSSAAAAEIDVEMVDLQAAGLQHGDEPRAVATSRDSVKLPARAQLSPAEFTSLAARVVDLKNIGRPPSFGGRDVDWSEWRFRFESSCSLLDLEGVMDASVLCSDPIGQEALNPDAKARGKLLYGLLVQLCSGKAFSVVRAAERHQQLLASVGL